MGRATDAPERSGITGTDRMPKQPERAGDQGASDAAATGSKTHGTGGGARACRLSARQQFNQHNQHNQHSQGQVVTGALGAHMEMRMDQLQRMMDDYMEGR